MSLVNRKRDIEDGGLQVWRKRDMQDSRGKAEDGLGEGQKVAWSWLCLVKRWSLVTNALSEVSARGS